MTKDNSLLVDYRMIELNDGEYPHWEGQSWADPSIDHAVKLAGRLLDDPMRHADIAQRGQREALLTHGNRAVGLRILNRLELLMNSINFAEKSLPINLNSNIQRNGMKTAAAGAPQ